MAPDAAGRKSGIGRECRLSPDRQHSKRDTPRREMNNEPSKTPCGLPAEGRLSILERSRAR